MQRKKKVIPKQTLIIEQSSTMKKLGYLSVAFGILCFTTIIPSIKLENIKGDAPSMFFIFFIILCGFVWITVVLPYHFITTKKRLIIKGDKFILKSNRKKCSINTSFKNMKWWRKIYAIPGLMNVSNKIQINFKGKKIMLDALEFKNFYELESYLKRNFSKKEKKAGQW